MAPDNIIESIKKYISILQTKDGYFYFATQNAELLNTEDTCNYNQNNFEFFDIKNDCKRTIAFADIINIFLITFTDETTPAYAKYTDSLNNDPFIDICNNYISKIKALNKSIFKNKINIKTFELVSKLLKYNDILKYYDIKLDFLDQQILFYDEGITEEFLSLYKEKILDNDGNLKLSLTSAILLSFFDRQTQEDILEDNNYMSRLIKLKSSYLYFLDYSKEKNINYLIEEKNKAIKDLSGIEKNYVIQNFDLLIDKFKTVSYKKELSYIDSEEDLIFFWPFDLDLSVEKFTVTKSLERNKNTGSVLLYSVADTPFFNLFKVYKEYTKAKLTFRDFEFLKEVSNDINIKQNIINKKLDIFNAKKEEIFEYLDKELSSSNSDEIRSDIIKLKEEILLSIDAFKKEVTTDNTLRDILKYWPLYLYPIPEELVVE
jgi:hypothetical protein